MSHVDDGELTAYADGAYPAHDPEALRIGAHLSTCENCRARLELAHALRDRAAEVLGYAAPTRVQMPAFESLEARLAPPARRPRRTIPLAWAASIIMALGLGWFGRGFWQNPPEMREMAVREAPVTGQATPNEDAVHQNAAGPAAAPAAPPTAAPAPGPSAQVADASGARRERADQRAEAERDMSGQAGFLAGRAANARVAEADAAPELAAKVTAESIAAAPVLRGEHITSAEAERRGLEIPRIPELPIARVVLNADTTSVVHTLPDGRLVTLIASAAPPAQPRALREAPAEAAPAAPQMAKTAAPPAIVVRVRNKIVRVAGDLPADSLAALAARVR